jgi:hypothetical protein
VKTQQVKTSGKFHVVCHILAKLMNINSDAEYAKYLQEKTLDELIEISESIDKNFNRDRYEKIKARIASIKKLQHIRQDYIPRTRISSEFPSTWNYVLIPVVVLISLSVAIAMIVKQGFSIALLIPLFMGGFLVLLFRLMHREYRDVEMDNDFLYVSSRKQEAKIPRSNIWYVSENMWVNIRPISVYFKEPTVFGESIAFVPKMILRNPFKANPLVEVLSQIPPKH